MANRKVAIVGAAWSDFGRVDDKTAFELHHQATTRALADAGIDQSRGRRVHVPRHRGPAAHRAGRVPGPAAHNWIDSTGLGGSVLGVHVLEHAVAAIAQGLIETVVLSYGSTSAGRPEEAAADGQPLLRHQGPDPVRRPLRAHPDRSRTPWSARRHMHEFGTTIEQLAEIAVSTRYNAGFNPDAYYRDPITIEDVQSSTMIADPFTKLHCCIRSDGGGAIVLTSEERARDCANTPVWVLGTGEAISHTTMSEWTDFTESPCVRSGEEGLRPGRGHPRRHRRGRGLRRLHPDGAAHPGGTGLLQEGRGRALRRGRQAPGGRAPCPPTPTAGASRPASRACGASSS